MGEIALAELERHEPQAFGRYVLYSPIARGGMATIYVARLVGDDGFSRVVAAKRLHPQFTEDPDFVTMFRDEAEIASKIHHPNVVPVLDIVLDREEVVLVQEYVHGVPLDRLFRAACMNHEPIPVRIVSAMLSGILSGLHAAHETRDERGESLGIVHRDVSPQNVMVSVDGIPRLLDFGIAKASSSAHVTRAGLLKGKLAYMAPEQVRGDEATRAADVYACGVVLWELLALRRLHAGRSETQILQAVLHESATPISAALEPARAAMPQDRWDAVMRLEPVLARAMASAPADRYAMASEMLADLLEVSPAASALEVAEWVKSRGAEYLERRQQVLASNEESWRSLSRVAVAGGAKSGVTRVRGGGETRSPGDAPVAPSAPPRDAQRSGRAVPWAVAAAAIVLSGTAVVAMASRAPAPTAEPARAAEAAPAPLASASAPDPTPGDPAPSASSFLAAPSMAAPAPARSFRAVVAPPRRVVVEPAPAPRAAPSPATSSAAPPRVDCDPPFYFEGTKKVFKPSCI